jgi:hypothetical protein
MATVVFINRLQRDQSRWQVTAGQDFGLVGDLSGAVLGGAGDLAGGGLALLECSLLRRTRVPVPVGYSLMDASSCG